MIWKLARRRVARGGCSPAGVLSVSADGLQLQRVARSKQVKMRFIGFPSSVAIVAVTLPFRKPDPLALARRLGQLRGRGQWKILHLTGSNQLTTFPRG